MRMCNAWKEGKDEHYKSREFRDVRLKKNLMFSNKYPKIPIRQMELMCTAQIIASSSLLSNIPLNLMSEVMEHCKV